MDRVQESSRRAMGNAKTEEFEAGKPQIPSCENVFRFSKLFWREIGADLAGFACSVPTLDFVAVE